jgi:hypothetical protein
MPTPPLTDEQCIEALNLIEQYGSGYNAVKAGHPVLPATTVDHRAKVGRMRGLKPTFNKEQPRIFTRKRLGRMHIVIPDCQIRPGVPLDHLDWVSNYIAEKQPDAVICIGDFADMEALSKYDVGTLRGENKRLKRDLAVAREGMQRLTQFRSVYEPAMHLTMGNHEERLDRFANEHPYLDEIVGTHMLRYEEFGWTVHPFLKVVSVDGVDYAHYFVTGESGRPVTSARALLGRRHRSAVMGHNQKTDIAFQPVTHQWGLFVGICNLHDEPYLGPQGNLVRRQIVVLHEVEEGRFDPMFVSLRYLEKAYS